MKSLRGAPVVLALVLSTHAISIPKWPRIHVNWDAQPSLDFSPEEKYLIETAPGETQWVTESDKWSLRRKGINFMDVTDDQDPVFAVTQASEVEYPSSIGFNATIRPLLEHLNKTNMHENLKNFTSFYTRYYKSEYGQESAAWLMLQVKNMVEESGADKYGATVEPFNHPWGQPSIIARLPGLSENTIVIGAHQDSINLFLPSFLPAPGADDDGSGTVTILEAFRVLLESKDIRKGRAKNTVEFHWYSAEEGGLLGSNAVFSAYRHEGKIIKAMLQQDMTGYIQGTLDAGKEESVGIITDYVDPGLTEFIKKVVTEYCDIPYVDTKCGYACSDHASASKQGYPSAFVIESEFEHSNKKIHGTGDVLDVLSFDHMLQHAKLTLSLAYELSFASFKD